MMAEKGKDIDRLVETIAQIKKEHANEIKEVEKKWKIIMQQRIDNLQAKHEEELNELTKEWQNERKVNSYRQIEVCSDLTDNFYLACIFIYVYTYTRVKYIFLLI